MGVSIEGRDMFSVYKSYTVAGIMGCLAVLIAGGLAVYYFRVYDFFIIMGTIGLLFLVVGLVSLLAELKFKKDVRDYIDDCHIGEYLDACKKVLGRKRSRDAKALYNASLSKAYLATGDFDEAHDHLLKIHSRKQRYDLNLGLADYHIATGSVGEATKILKALKEMPGSVFRQDLDDEIKARELDLRVLKGDFDGLEEALTDQIMKSKTVLERVARSVSLGRVLVAGGKEDQALKVLRFAINNGGDTCYVEQAKSLLVDISYLEEIS